MVNRQLLRTQCNCFGDNKHQIIVTLYPITRYLNTTQKWNKLIFLVLFENYETKGIKNKRLYQRMELIILPQASQNVRLFALQFCPNRSTL